MPPKCTKLAQNIYLYLFIYPNGILEECTIFNSKTELDFDNHQYIISSQSSEVFTFDKACGSTIQMTYWENEFFFNS